MEQNTLYLCGLVLVTGLTTYLLRAFPFLAFGMGNRRPGFLVYIGNVLPPAAIAMLSVYCLAAYFQNVTFASKYFGAAEFAASAVVVLLQLWKRIPLLSILAGTAVYMVLIQKVLA